MLPGGEHQDRSDQEAECAEQRAGDRYLTVDEIACGGKDVARERRGHEKDASDHVPPGNPPRQGTWSKAKKAPNGEDGEDARHQEQGGPEEIRSPHAPLLLLGGRVVPESGRSTDVEE